MLVDGWILVRVARQIGVYLALAIEATTAIAALVIVGSSINRHLARIHKNALNGRFDPHAYARFFTIVIAGVMLVVPGFASDLIGLVMYLPPTRRLFVAIAARILGARLPVLDEHLKLQLFSGDDR